MTENDNFLKEMGKRIASKRKEMNLTQEQLAEKAEVTSQMLSNAERGIKALRPENLLKICLAIDESVDYILTGNVATKRNSSLTTKLDNLTFAQNKLINEIIDKCVELSNV